MSSNKDKIFFYQGGYSLGDKNCLKSIKHKISELSNIKNVSFLLGAGASSGAIPSMKAMQEEIGKNILDNPDEEMKKLYGNIDGDDLEKKLTILHARKNYLLGITNTDKTKISTTKKLIKCIECLMYSKINIDFSNENPIKNLELYKKLYQKTALRNKDLSRLNIFTTNNDLFNEKALDALNINYNNGFGGGLERVFNPAWFNFTF